MHEWITDNGQTPHVIVDASVEGVQVPQAYVKDGKIVLNIAYAAANSLQMGNEWIEFDARFSGVPHRVRVPLRACVGIYSRETGQGMAFSESDLAPQPEPPEGPPADSAPASTVDSRRARLKIVK
jgi:stringent starvation protein B